MPAVERDAAERGVEQRGLAAAVGAEQRDPLAVVDREVDRAERERPARDGRAVELGDDRAAARRRPRSPCGGPSSPTASRPRSASSRSSARSVIFAFAATCSLLLRRKCRMNLSVSPLLATLAAPCTDHCRCSRARLRSVSRCMTYVAVVLLGVPAGGRPLGEVRGPAARRTRSRCGRARRARRTLVTVRSRNARSCETITAPPARSSCEEPLEPVEAGEVEVVGRLVEEEHVEAREQDRGEVRPGRLPARQRRHRRGRASARAGRGRRAPRRCGRRGRPRRARGTASSASAYSSAEPSSARGERVARLVEPQLGRGDAGAAREVARARSRPRAARAPAGGSRRSRSAACASPGPASGASMPARMRSSVLLPVPLGATTPMRLRGPTVRLTPVEHDVRAERLADVAGDEAGERVTGGSGREERTRRHLRESSGREGLGACRARRDPQARKVVRRRRPLEGRQVEPAGPDDASS